MGWGITKDGVHILRAEEQTGHPAKWWELIGSDRKLMGWHDLDHVNCDSSLFPHCKDLGCFFCSVYLHRDNYWAFCAGHTFNFLLCFSFENECVYADTFPVMILSSCTSGSKLSTCWDTCSILSSSKEFSWKKKAFISPHIEAEVIFPCCHVFCLRVCK